MSGVSDYRPRYAIDSASAQGKKTVSADAGTTTKTAGKLTFGTTYYVRVRAVAEIEGAKYYTSWSTKKSVVAGQTLQSCDYGCLGKCSGVMLTQDEEAWAWEPGGNGPPGFSMWNEPAMAVLMLISVIALF